MCSGKTNFSQSRFFFQGFEHHGRIKFLSALQRKLGHAEKLPIYKNLLALLELGAPTQYPTSVPTAIPSFAPSALPTTTPTAIPTTDPSPIPTALPTGVVESNTDFFIVLEVFFHSSHGRANFSTNHPTHSGKCFCLQSSAHEKGKNDDRHQEELFF